MTTALDSLRGVIEASGAAWRPRGQHALMASCPLHEDATPSLSITWTARPGRAGMVLLHCFACQAPARDLAQAFGLHLGDLFDDADTARPAITPTARHQPRRPATSPAQNDHRWQRVRVYTYTTAAGHLVQQVLREQCQCRAGSHKRFLQRYRDGRTWTWRKPAGFRPVLYRARDLAAADPAEWVWLVEGEKDADTAARLGRVATTNAQGAGQFPAELLADLAGRPVAIVIDRDPAGYQRGLHLHAALRGRAAQLRLLLPAPTHAKADLSDHVDAGQWNPADPFGGLHPVTVAELEQLHQAQRPGHTQKAPPCSPHR